MAGPIRSPLSLPRESLVVDLPSSEGHRSESNCLAIRLPVDSPHSQAELTRDSRSRQIVQALQRPSTLRATACSSHCIPLSGAGSGNTPAARVGPQAHPHAVRRPCQQTIDTIDWLTADIPHRPCRVPPATVNTPPEVGCRPGWHDGPSGAGEVTGLDEPATAGSDGNPRRHAIEASGLRFKHEQHDSEVRRRESEARRQKTKSRGQKKKAGGFRPSLVRD